MKAHIFLSAIFSQALLGSCVPSDPLNLDLCGLAGLDLDLTPATSLPGPFEILFQHQNFTGPLLSISDINAKAVELGNGGSSKFTLANGALKDVTGRSFRINFASGQSTWTFLANKNSVVASFEAKHTCDPMTGDALTLLVPIRPSMRQSHSDASLCANIL